MCACARVCRLLYFRERRRLEAEVLYLCFSLDAAAVSHLANTHRADFQLHHTNSPVSPATLFVIRPLTFFFPASAVL